MVGLNLTNHDIIRITKTVIVIVMVLGAFLLSRWYRSRISKLNVGTPESFARLLLKDLGNRTGIEDAQSQRAVYRTFRSDIDGAREVFLARFPTCEHIFYNALVSTVSRGDAQRLGSDYPHPRTLTPPIS